jgi:hypothetical protein
MISLVEIRYSVAGALRLARGDAGGLDHFDDSSERFWRSFWAAVVCAPMVIIIIYTAQSAKPPKDWTHYFLVVTLNYVIAWALWALVMIYIADAVQRAHRYFRYMQAYNWAQVVGTAAKFLLVLLAQGMAGQGLAVLLLFATLAILFYEWFVTRHALDVSGPQAAGVVAFNLVLMLTVDYASAAFTQLEE